MPGKTWAGLCALQLQRQQQPSPPRLEIIQELGKRDEAAEDTREGHTGILGEIYCLLLIAFWMSPP